MYLKHDHHSFSSWSGTLQLHLIYQTQQCNRNVLQTINVSEVLTIQFLLQSSS